MMKLDLQMFGASASNQISLYCAKEPNKYPYYLTALFTENSTNTINNTSNVSVTASLQANGAYWTTSYQSTLEIYWYDNKTGTETLKASTTFQGLSGLHDSKSTSTTFDAPHNTDGTLAGYAKAVFTKGSTTANTACPNGNVATNLVALTSIARVSNVACTSPYVGDTAIVTINRNDNSYKDTITYTIGNLSGTIATKTSSTTISFDTSSLANNIYGQMSSTSQSIQGTITIQTYNANDVSLGTNSTTFYLYAKESDCKPTINFDVITTDNTSLTLAGNNTTIINGISETSLTYTATANKGATLTSKYIVDYSELPASPVTNWIIATPTLTMIAVDSRGFTSNLTKTFDFVSYFYPTISMQTYRTAPTSSEIKAKFQGTFFNDTFGSTTNSLTLVVKYRVKGTSTWTTLRTLAENTDYTISNNNFWSGTSSSTSDIVLDSNAFSYQNIYEIAIFYQDAIVDTYTSRFVSKGVPVVNWKDEKFYVNGELYVSNAEGENPIAISHNYSTTEQIIGYWIDGKPLYRKVINFGNLPNATSKSVAHNISNLKRVIKMQGYAYSSQSGFDIPIPYTSNGYLISLRCDDTYVVVTPMTDQTSFDECYITLEYTKTTD